MMEIASNSVSLYIIHAAIVSHYSKVSEALEKVILNCLVASKKFRNDQPSNLYF